METYGEILKRLGDEEFTGRSFECLYFSKMLEQSSGGTAKILNIFGTGGIGKTTLLMRFRILAEREDALFLSLEMRQYIGNPNLFIQGLASKLDIINMDNIDPTESVNRIVDSLYSHAAGRKIVLSFDQYEEAGGIDQWLREKFFPRLRSDTLIVIAGRNPLNGSWKLSSLWRRLIVTIPLSELQYDEVKTYLHRLGIQEELMVDRLWLLSSGHPLSLSLLAEYAGNGLLRNDDTRRTLEELLQYWLQEVPDEQLRSLVYAASIPRSFDQEMLHAVIGEHVATEVFERFIDLSFVQSSAKGWQLHDLVREAVRHSFRERQPDTFMSFRDRLNTVLNERIRSKWILGVDASFDVYELISQSGNPILRAHFRYNRGSENYWETVTQQTLPEIERYIEQRKANAKTSRIMCSDPESDKWFRYLLTGEQSLYRFSGWAARELAAFGEDSLRILRAPDGEVVGLAAMLTIGHDTLSYLEQSPISAPYSSYMSEIQAEKGDCKFIFAIDTMDPERLDMRSDTVHLMMEHVLSGSLLIAAPPELPFYKDSHLSIGFHPIVSRGCSYFYSPETQSVGYLLDTRGEKLADFLEVTAHFVEGTEGTDSGQGSHQLREEASLLGVFTPREREVAALLAQGATNKEIAGTLYISEAAVKKHLNAMLQKTGLKNRTQIAAAMLTS